MGTRRGKKKVKKKKGERKVYGEGVKPYENIILI